MPNYFHTRGIIKVGKGQLRISKYLFIGVYLETETPIYYINRNTDLPLKPEEYDPLICWKLFNYKNAGNKTFDYFREQTLRVINNNEAE